VCIFFGDEILANQQDTKIHNLTKRGTFVTAQPNQAHLCCKHLKAEQIKAWGSGPPKKPICQFCGFGGPQFAVKGKYHHQIK
jgi:hypothetical protein